MGADITYRCVQGDITTSWGIFAGNPNPTLNIILQNLYGLSTLVGLKAVNITMTAFAYDPNGAVLAILDPLIGDEVRTLPEGTVKVVVVGTRQDQSLAASYDAMVTDMCGLFSGRVDPVIAQVKVGNDGAGTHLVVSDVPAFEHYVSVQNGRPGLRALRLYVNGQRHEFLTLAEGETVYLDVSTAMVPGSDNTMVLEGEGMAGASAVVSIGDSPVNGGSGPVQIMASDSTLRVERTAAGLELSWGFNAAVMELQSLEELSGGGGWISRTEEPVREGARWVVRMPLPSGDAQFFRLEGR